MAWILEVIEGMDKGKKTMVSRGCITIGRDSQHAGIVLSGEGISRRHAVLRITDTGEVFLEDLNSTNGTKVNGVWLEGKKELFPQDTIEVGQTQLRLLTATGQAASSHQFIQSGASPSPHSIHHASQPAMHEWTKAAPFTISLGREANNTVVLNDPDVSRRHATLTFQGDTFTLTDLQSSHGTRVNGELINGTAQVARSSWIQMGQTSMYLEAKQLFFEDGRSAYAFPVDDPHQGLPSKSIQIADTLRAPFLNGGLLKWLLGCVLSMIPLVNLLTEGYRLETCHAAYRGNLSLPAWANWGGLMVKGFYMTAIYIVYLLIPGVLTLILLFLGFYYRGIPTAAQVTLVPITLLFYLVSVTLLPMAWSRFAASEKLSDAFQVGEIGRLLATQPGPYALVVIITLAMWLALILISFIPILGSLVVILGAFYINAVFSLFMGQIHGVASRSASGA